MATVKLMQAVEGKKLDIALTAEEAEALSAGEVVQVDGDGDVVEVRITAL